MDRTAEVSTLAEEDLIIGVDETQADSEVIEKANIFANNYKKSLEERTYAMAEAVGAGIEAGGPVIGAASYAYWNCLTIGPVMFGPTPPYRPAKIARAGELLLMLGVIWVNPMLGPGGTLSGSTVLGARPYRARFGCVNLTNVTAGPSMVQSNTFPSPAPVVTVIPWLVTFPNPGLDPHLMEINFTVDVTTGGQPFAAFSTWHFDLDNEPPIPPFVPAAPAHTQFEIPARILVYQE